MDYMWYLMEYTSDIAGSIFHVIDCILQQSVSYISHTTYHMLCITDDVSGVLPFCPVLGGE